MKETRSPNPAVSKDRESNLDKLKSLLNSLRQKLVKISKELWGDKTSKGQPISELIEIVDAVSPENQTEAREIITEIKTIDAQIEEQIEGALQLGSTTGGVVYKEEEGAIIKYYLKYRKGDKAERESAEEHLKAEYVASELYRRFGIKVPEVDITRGEDQRIILVSKFVSSQENPQIYQEPTDNPDIRDGFIMDVLIGNYDIYLNSGNLVTTQQGTYRVDNGSAFMWKARGSRKKNQEGLYDSYTENPITELELYRNISHPNWVDNYGNRWKPYFAVDISEEEISSQVQKMEEIFTDEVIDEIINSAEFNPDNREELKRLLIQRRNWLIERYSKVKPANEIRNTVLDEILLDGLSERDIKHYKSFKIYQECNKLSQEEAEKFIDEFIKEFQKFVGQDIEITKQVKRGILTLILQYENFENLEEISTNLLKFFNLIQKKGISTEYLNDLLNILNPKEIKSILEEEVLEDSMLEGPLKVIDLLNKSRIKIKDNIELNYTQRKNAYENIRKIMESIKVSETEFSEDDLKNIYETLFNIPGMEKLIVTNKIDNLNEVVESIIKLKDTAIRGILKSENFLNPERIEETSYLINKLKKSYELSTITKNNKLIQEFIYQIVSNSNTNFELNPEEYEFLLKLSNEKNNEENLTITSLPKVLKFIKNESDFKRLLLNLEDNSDLEKILKLMSVDAMEETETNIEEILFYFQKIIKSENSELSKIHSEISMLDQLIKVNRLIEEGILDYETLIKYFNFLDSKIIDNIKDYDLLERQINVLTNEIKKSIASKQFFNYQETIKHVENLLKTEFYRKYYQSLSDVDKQKFNYEIKKLILEVIIEKDSKMWINSFSLGYMDRDQNENMIFYNTFIYFGPILEKFKKNLEESNQAENFNEYSKQLINFIVTYRNKLEIQSISLNPDEKVPLEQIIQDIELVKELLESYSEIIKKDPNSSPNEVFTHILNSDVNISKIPEFFNLFKEGIRSNENYNQLFLERPELLEVLFSADQSTDKEYFIKIFKSLSKETIFNPNLQQQIRNISNLILKDTVNISNNLTLILSGTLDLENTNLVNLEEIKTYIQKVTNNNRNEPGKIAFLIKTFKLRELTNDSYVSEIIQPAIEYLYEQIQKYNEKRSSGEFVGNQIDISDILNLIEALGKENQIELVDFLKENLLSAYELAVTDIQTINRAIELLEIDPSKSLELRLSLKFLEVKDPHVIWLKREIINFALQNPNPEEKIEELLNILNTEDLPFFARRFLFFKIVYNDEIFENSQSSSADNSRGKGNIFSRKTFNQSREEVIGDGKRINRSEKLDSDRINFGFDAVRYTVFLDLLRSSLETGERSLIEFLTVLKEGVNLIEIVKSNGIESLNQNQLMTLKKCLFLCNLLIKESPFIREEVKNSLPEVSQELSDNQEILNILTTLNQLLKINENGNLINQVSRYYLRPLGFKSIEEAISKARKVKPEADLRNRELVQSGFHLQEGDMMKSINGTTIQLILETGFYGQEVLGNDPDATPMDHDLGEVTKDASTKTIKEAYELNAASYNSTGRGNPEDDLVVIIRPGQKYQRAPEAKTEERYRYDNQTYEVIDRSMDTNYPNHIGIRTASPATDIQAILMPKITSEIALDFEKPADYETAFIFYQVSNNGYYIPFFNGNNDIVFSEQDYDKYKVRKEGIKHIIESDKINVSELVNLFSDNPFIRHLMGLDAGVSEGITIKEHTEMVLDIFEKYFSQKEGFSFISREEIRTLLLFHDIGKGWSYAVTGSTYSQHEYTNKVLTQALLSIDTDPRKISLLLDLIDQDLIGDLIKGNETVDKVANEIIKLSTRHSIQTKELLDFLIIFYSSDAGAYTSNAGPKGGNLDYLFNIDDMTLSETNKQRIQELRNKL